MAVNLLWNYPAVVCIGKVGGALGWPTRTEVCYTRWEAARVEFVGSNELVPTIYPCMHASGVECHCNFSPNGGPQRGDEGSNNFL
jgi:hypothetical protein